MGPRGFAAPRQDDDLTVGGAEVSGHHMRHGKHEPATDGPFKQAGRNYNTEGQQSRNDEDHVLIRETSGSKKTLERQAFPAARAKLKSGGLSSCDIMRASHKSNVLLELSRAGSFLGDTKVNKLETQYRVTGEVKQAKDKGASSIGAGSSPFRNAASDDDQGFNLFTH